MNLENIRLGVSPLTDTVYMGTVDPKDPGLWRSKRKATHDILQCLMTWCPVGTVREFVDDQGNKFEIRLTQVKSPAPEQVS